jgi:hypothetical protein
MDPAVSLVRVYLATCGFFVETEFPVIARAPGVGIRSVTDIDVLAVRFPGTYRYLPSDGADQSRSSRSRMQNADPRLEMSENDIEFIIAEVKEGRAELNKGATNPEVLRTALARFGAFSQNEMDRIIDELLRKGHSTAARGMRVRVFAFGSSVPTPPPRACTTVTHAQIVRHLMTLRDAYDDYSHAMQFGDDMLSMFMLLLKSGVKIEAPERSEGKDAEEKR